MGDKWEPPKLSQTHVFRHEGIFCLSVLNLAKEDI